MGAGHTSSIRLECSAARAPLSQGVKYTFVKQLLTSAAIMLSRLAVRSAMVPRCLAGARELATTPALAERDLVNFPPRQRPIERGPVKALIFPAEWFDPLYPKTGVTGPYMALFGVSTFLASKEYFVMEHDFYVGMGLAIVMTYLIKTQGPAYTEAINKQLDEEEAALKAIRQDEIDACLAQIKGEQAVQEQATAWQDIIAAKKGLSACSWRENTEAGLPLPTPLSRRGWTTRWRPPMCSDAWSRSTRLTGSLET